MASNRAVATVDDDDLENVWSITQEVSERISVPEWAARNAIRLLEEDHTIPFIARYRKEKTANMEAHTLRDLKEVYDELKSVKAKCKSVMAAIEKQGKLTPNLKGALRASRTLSEIDHLYAPFKPGSKRSLAERARELGLEKLAMRMLQKPDRANINEFVNPSKEGLKTHADVVKGVKHIIAEVISKNKEVLDELRNSADRSVLKLESTISRAANKKTKEAQNAVASGGAGGGGRPSSAKNKQKNDAQNFENYFDFSIPIKYVKPHQVMAINRGEEFKALSVRVNVPREVKDHLNYHIRRNMVHENSNNYVTKLIQESFDDSYSRLLEPLITRKCRSDLKKNAEKASIEVFASNLKRLLLMPPVRGRVVLGVDPGFKNGCKWAVTSETGKVLETGVEYLHTRNGPPNIQKIKEVLLRHSCETVAIGNGTACRETEAVFADCIRRGVFQPLNVVYCIVSESGASIYSASEVAEKELPELDVSIRGAVSIARRLQDPLAELVKIEPKHIGVGMYQHDVSEAQLKASLDSVVEECVSFVGVDLNVCGEMLLKRIAGLNATRAKKILEWRENNGPFICRDQLRSVSGIGAKTFEQCAGFVRVLQQTSVSEHTGDSEVDGAVCSTTGTSKGKKRKAPSSSRVGKKKAKLDVTPNPLDQTCIHPESYEVAERLLEKVGVSKDGIGSEDFINKVQQFVKCHTQYLGYENLATELGVGEPTMQLIITGLTQPINQDMREEFEKPLFKKEMTRMEDLHSGTQLTGRVTNVTHFGAFVDIGVGRDALIHKSKISRHLLRGKPGLELGDKVEVIVLAVDTQRSRIQLELKELL